MISNSRVFSRFYIKFHNSFLTCLVVKQNDDSYANECHDYNIFFKNTSGAAIEREGFLLTICLYFIFIPLICIPKYYLKNLNSARRQTMRNARIDQLKQCSENVKQV